MPARLAADALVLFHLAFIVFVVVGGFMAWRPSLFRGEARDTKDGHGECEGQGKGHIRGV